MATLATLAACSGSEPEIPDCSEDRCNSFETKDQLIDAIRDHRDPIADMLRNLATEAATIEGDYNDVLDELGALVGCDASTESSFVVLSNTDFVPKTVFARCADSPQAASQFFVAAPTLAGDDMDARSLHLTGWDDEAQKYRHYATAPTDEGGTAAMNINVEPSFCLGCHGGPEKLPEWQPLMNEMTNPWSGWNAEPGFQSQLFDEFLDQDVAGGAVYNEMLSSVRLESASNLEPLIRAGIGRTVGARILGRNRPALERDALDLLRPLFCDETVNYVSEVHDSGEVRLDAVVDEGLRDILAKLLPNEPWSWREDDVVLMSPLESGRDPVTLIATRATISVEFERALRARQVLSDADVLRARAIDWQNPVASDERCGVFRAARDRIEAGAVQSAVSALPADATSEALMPIYFEEILRDHPALETSALAALGAAVDAKIGAIAATDFREQLRDQRDQRGCWAAERFLAAPIIPDLTCR